MIWYWYCDDKFESIWGGICRRRRGIVLMACAPVELSIVNWC